MPSGVGHGLLAAASGRKHSARQCFIESRLRIAELEVGVNYLPRAACTLVLSTTAAVWTIIYFDYTSFAD
jgi:hypothetical protein